MDPVTNPFRPGAGRLPPVLAGRAPLLADFDIVMRRASTLSEGDRSWVLSGLRGVGKTALLNTLLATASEQRWITAKVEVSPGRPLAGMLADALVRGMRNALGRHPEPLLRRVAAALKAFSVSWNPDGISVGLDVEALAGVGDSGRLAEDLYSLLMAMGTASRDLNIGTLILIDELQEASADDLRELNQAFHLLAQEPVAPPVLMVGAGLPSLPSILADVTSYAERLYDYRTIGLLDRAAAEVALVAPVTARGESWSPAALDLALDAARGYPYLIQAVGKHVWDLAVRSPISVADTQVGLRLAGREVDEGLYLSRWERSTAAQQALLRALAEVGGESAAVADIVRAAGKTNAGQISMTRRELIRKGILYAPERGFLAFTVPGMHEFVLRQEP